MTEDERLAAITYHLDEIKKLLTVHPTVNVCPKGHPFTPENTRWGGPKKTWRRCITCHKHAARLKRGWDTPYRKYMPQI